jgi:glycosyltransferase involved in cell wall biosynthesis
MIHELFPEYFSIIDFTIAHKKQLLENADLIIAISENTKKDIVKFTNVDPDRIRVIYHGNPFERMTEFSPVNTITYPKIFEKPYVLFVGTRSIYKNFIFFITSVSVLLHKYDELHVCCAGGGPFTPREKQIFSKLNILHKVHYFQTNDYITKNLYLHAQLFIFPSLYEGFGLPVLEAFSCGCPAVLSNTSSLPEIGGDAAIYIEPDNAESIVQGIERVLFNQDVKEDLRRKGYNRLTLFSWEKTAFKTKKVYDNLLYQ